MAREGAIRAVAGLGNPGESYRRNRHNAGWMLLDQLLGRWRVGERRRLDWVEATRVETRGRGAGLWLLRPTTYMNRSGLGVSEGCDALDVGPGELLIAYDDIDLPLGRVRLRQGGGDGGHRGMRSVLESLGTPEVPRLRLGIRGQEAPADTADYVLEDFAEDELEVVREMVDRAADAVELALRSGLVAAMNAFN